MQLVFSCFSLLDSFFISYMKGIITRTWQCLLLISIFVDSHVYMIKNSLITYIYIIIVFSHILFTTFVYVNLTENTNSINNSHLCIFDMINHPTGQNALLLSYWYFYSENIEGETRKMILSLLKDKCQKLWNTNQHLFHHYQRSFHSGLTWNLNLHKEMYHILLI